MKKNRPVVIKEKNKVEVLLLNNGKKIIVRESPCITTTLLYADTLAHAS